MFVYLKKKFQVPVIEKLIFIAAHSFHLKAFIHRNNNPLFDKIPPFKKQT